jgi:hypothetical protein
LIFGSGIEDSVSGITESREDVAAVVELSIDGGGQDLQFGEALIEVCHPFGCREKARQPD